MDQLEQFKERQRQGWSSFAPFEMTTLPTAAHLVAVAGVSAGQAVLDVGCGTGVVALTAAARGARTTGLDLTPALLERARDNAATAGLEVEWHAGDAEALPFADGTFDVVLSQFGHMFAPRPEVATGEMLRVLKPGGVIAFSTWPPHLFTARMFALTARYAPAPGPGRPPGEWGEPEVVRARLGDAVRGLRFDSGRLLLPALSPAHARSFFERNAGPVRGLVAALAAAPERLAAFRAELEALVAEYFEPNQVRQDYLVTRAVKV